MTEVARKSKMVVEVLCTNNNSIYIYIYIYVAVPRQDGKSPTGGM